jgi:hypothetical protein
MAGALPPVRDVRELPRRHQAAHGDVLHQVLAPHRERRQIDDADVVLEARPP